MNEYEILYKVKRDIETVIAQNNLFKLKKETAVKLVLEKSSVWYKMLSIVSEEKGQREIKKKIGTNATEIASISFFQESLKWIIRWCMKYCVEEKESDVKIVVEDIQELMGMAYSYEMFANMWDLHYKHYVKYAKYENEIIFDYIDEETFKVHAIYDNLRDEEEIFVKQLRILDSIKNEKENNFLKLMEKAHEIEFEELIDVDFGGFSLSDYKIFSTTLNNIIAQKVSQGIKYHIMIPKIEGIMWIKKEEWVTVIEDATGLTREKVDKIIQFFTYDITDKKADISLTYFFPYDKDYLLLGERIYDMQSPESNALRLLGKKQSREYNNKQNQFEKKQKEHILNKINKKYLVAEIKEQEKKIRSGMDCLVYDKKENYLQVIELKYKIPIESTQDIANLGEMLEKACVQLDIAKEYVENYRETILKEYFGDDYGGVIPDKIDYFIITNNSIGVGRGIKLPSPILRESHYIQLMKRENGMEVVGEVLNDYMKGMDGEIKKRYARFHIGKYKILIPEYRREFI